MVVQAKIVADSRQRHMESTIEISVVDAMFPGDVFWIETGPTEAVLVVESGEFLAVDVLTGDRLWQTAWPLGERPQRSGTTFIVKQADRYWLFNDQGELMIAKLTPQGYEEIDF